MTRAELYQRNRAILRAYRAGARVSAIAAQHDLTERRVSGIASDAGCSRPRGRPRDLPNATEAEAQEYRRYRKYFGLEMAREMMGLRP